MKRLLELFSGTGSVGNEMLKLKKVDSVHSIDIHPKYNPTTCTDILKWNYKQFPPGYFHMIWASPPCTEYSLAKTRAPRDLELADKIVKRTLKIIKYYNPRHWFLENPVGLLKQRSFMQPLKMNTCTYCKYGTQFKKPTNIWSNHDLPLKYCTRKNPCKGSTKTGVHPISSQQGRFDTKQGRTYGTTDINKVYPIPPKLVSHICTYI